MSGKRRHYRKTVPFTEKWCSARCGGKRDLSYATSCRACRNAYMRRRYVAAARAVPCRRCGAPRERGQRCRPCRATYMRAWRRQHRSPGGPRPPVPEARARQRLIWRLEKRRQQRQRQLETLPLDALRAVRSFAGRLPGRRVRVAPAFRDLLD